MSQTVRALERRIGGRLFDRTSSHVQLTTLGEHFRAQVRPGTVQVQDTPTNLSLEQARDGGTDLVAAYLPLAQADLTIGPLLS